MILIKFMNIFKLSYFRSHQKFAVHHHLYEQYSSNCVRRIIVGNDNGDTVYRHD